MLVSSAMSICGGLCMLGYRALGEVSLSTVLPDWKFVLVGSATLLYIFGTLGKNSLKPSCFVFRFVTCGNQLPLCRILTGRILERSALTKLGTCSGQDHIPLHSSVDMAGKESVIVSDDLACSAKCQECPMFSQGGVLSTTNGQQSLMVGWAGACAGGLGGGGAHMPPPRYFGQWTELLSWIFHSFLQSSAPTETFLRH